MQTSCGTTCRKTNVICNIPVLFDFKHLLTSGHYLSRNQIVLLQDKIVQGIPQLTDIQILLIIILNTASTFLSLLKYAYVKSFEAKALLLLNFCITSKLIFNKSPTLYIYDTISVLVYFLLKFEYYLVIISLLT